MMLFNTRHSTFIAWCMRCLGVFLSACVLVMATYIIYSQSQYDNDDISDIFAKHASLDNAEKAAEQIKLHTLKQLHTSQVQRTTQTPHKPMTGQQKLTEPVSSMTPSTGTPHPRGRANKFLASSSPVTTSPATLPDAYKTTDAATKETAAPGDEDMLDANSDISIEHEERIGNMLAACSNPGKARNPAYNVTHDAIYYYSNAYDFAYCRAQKVGSTFWTQIYTVLEKGVAAGRAMFSSPRHQVHKRQLSFLKSFEEVRDKFLPTILISRDPYSRLYSAYVDKIFLPLMFSKNFEIRGIDYEEHVFYGHCPKDVTFQEFLDWIIRQAKRNNALNAHWAPISSVCRPCDVNAFLIVRQETFEQDVNYALREIHVEEEKLDLILYALGDHRVERTVSSIVETIYGLANTINVGACLGWKEVATRTWKSFQIQGYLDEKLSFPFQRFRRYEQFSDYEHVSAVFLEAIKITGLSQDRGRQQRQRILARAYSKIKPATIESIQRIYKQDFQLFGYNNLPPAAAEKASA